MNIFTLSNLSFGKIKQPQIKLKGEDFLQTPLANYRLMTQIEMCTPVTFVRLFAMGALLSCFSADLIKPRGGFLSSSCVSYCFFFINTSFIFNSTPKFLQMQWEKSDKSI